MYLVLEMFLRTLVFLLGLFCSAISQAAKSPFVYEAPRTTWMAACSDIAEYYHAVEFDLILDPLHSANRELLKRGLFPVTMIHLLASTQGKLDYPATNYWTDTGDDTDAIQWAINTARECGFVTFFPKGIYHITKTLLAIQRLDTNGSNSNPADATELSYLVGFDDAEVNPKHKFKMDRRRANNLLGARGGVTIKLRGNAADYFKKNPNNITDCTKLEDASPAVWMWAQQREGPANRGDDDPQFEQANISFNQVFRNIDIDLNQLPCAIGIRHAGSQGSTLEEVSINAVGGFAGIVNPPGQGGGFYDIKITGGQYGIYADNLARYPVGVGVELIEQTKNSIHWVGQSSMTLVGFRIVRLTTPGPAITVQYHNNSFQRTWSLIDGIIEVNNGYVGIENTNYHGNGKNIYIKDLYTKSNSGVIHSGGNLAINNSDEGWTRVHEYSFTDNYINQDMRRNVSLIGGREMPGAGVFISKLRNVSTPPDFEQFKSRHLWDVTFPASDDTDLTVVDMTDVSIAGNDCIENAALINGLLVSDGKVLIPPTTNSLSVVDSLKICKGLYLEPGDQLLGAAKHLSVLEVGKDWNDNIDRSIILAKNTLDGATSLSNLLLENRNDKGVINIHWKAGERSIVRDMMIGNDANIKITDSVAAHLISMPNIALIKITNSGGGRWYGLTAEYTRLQAKTKESHSSYRHLLINGTTEPLSFYGLNVERSEQSPQSEIRNAKNVKIYYLKAESKVHSSINNDDAEPRSAVMHIRNTTPSTVASDIDIFGYSGTANHGEPIGNEIFKVENVYGITIANISHVNPLADNSNSIPTAFNAIQETYAGSTVKVLGSNTVSVFSRGSTVLREIELNDTMEFLR